MRRSAIRALLIFCWSAASLMAVEEIPLKVSHLARSLQPGEVVLLRVRSSPLPERVEGRAFGREVAFFREGDSWWGLLGIDLGEKSGNHSVAVTAFFEADASPREVLYRLTVKPKKFPVRYLKVDSKFVDPPQETLARIRRESARLSRIFKASRPQRLWNGAFSLPVPGKASSSFGKRSVFNGKPRSPHSGTDFDATAGTPIKAPAAGVVVLMEDRYYSGNTVVIDHGLGLFSYFAHLSRFEVGQGARLSQGDVVGLVGATGRVTGPHLHWSLRLNGARVDPLSLVNLLESNAP